MFPIQRNYWADLKVAKSTPGLMDNYDSPKNPCKLDLYRFIANYIGAYWQTDSVDELYQNIDDRNMELAVVGIAESMVETESTVIDKMAATIDRPVKRVAVPPVKRPMPVVKGGLSAATARPGVVVGRSQRIQRPVKNGVVV
jgi:hypothetical protein